MPVVLRSKLCILFIKLAMYYSTWGWTHEKLTEALENEQSFIHWWKE